MKKLTKELCRNNIPKATLINLKPRQLRWRIIVALRSKLISLRKCVNKVDIRIKVALIYAHSHKSVLP
jgi:hypothetical protein